MNEHPGLAEAIEPFRATPKSGGLFARGRRAKPTKKRLEAAHRLAALAPTADAGADPADMLEALRLAADEFPTDTAVRVAFATALANAGRHADAVPEYEELLRMTGEDPAVLRALAAQYERAGRKDLAVERLQRAVDATVHAGDLDAAVDAARALIELEPTSLDRASDLVAMLRARDPARLADALEHLADVHRERGKLGLEADACRQLFALEPERPGARARLCDLYARILEVDPDDADAWAGLEAADASMAGRLRERVHPNGATASGPVAAAQPAPAAPEAHRAYAARKAAELMHAGDVVGASLCLERAAQSSPSAPLLLELAKCYEALHRETDAVRAALRSIAVGRSADEGPPVDAALGWLCDARPSLAVPVGDAVLLSGRPESADTLYEELLRVWDEATGEAAAAE